MHSLRWCSDFWRRRLPRWQRQSFKIYPRYVSPCPTGLCCKQDGEGKSAAVPGESREQMTGGLMDRLTRHRLAYSLAIAPGRAGTILEPLSLSQRQSTAACSGQAYGAQYAAIWSDSALCNR